MYIYVCMCVCVRVHARANKPPPQVQGGCLRQFEAYPSTIENEQMGEAA